MVLVDSYCNKTLPKSRRQTVVLDRYFGIFLSDLRASPRMFNYRSPLSWVLNSCQKDKACDNQAVFPDSVRKISDLKKQEVDQPGYSIEGLFLNSCCDFKILAFWNGSCHQIFVRFFEHSHATIKVRPFSATH